MAENADTPSMEQFEMTLLGTAATLPTRTRDCSATLVHIGGEYTLIDAGEGVQRKLLQEANLGPSALERVILTHYHADHYLGLPSLIKTRAGNDGAPLPIYCLVTNAPLLKALFDATFTHPSLYQLIPVNFGDRIRLSKEWNAEVLEAKHTVPAMSLVLQENDQPPVLDAGRAVLDGASRGPMMGQLARGEIVTLDDGRVLNGSDYLSPVRPGRKVVYTGDTAQTVQLAEAAKGANIIVCEATYLDRDTALAVKNGHTTGREAGLLAKNAGCSRLVLTHFSTRYVDKNAPSYKYVLAEATKAAGESVRVQAGFDGMAVPL